MTFEDWANSTGVFGEGLLFPNSCCDPPCDTSNNTMVFTNGCIDSVTTFLQDQLLIVASIGIAFVVGEVGHMTMHGGGAHDVGIL